MSPARPPHSLKPRHWLGGLLAVLSIHGMVAWAAVKQWEYSTKTDAGAGAPAVLAMYMAAPSRTEARATESPTEPASEAPESSPAPETPPETTRTPAPLPVPIPARRESALPAQVSEPTPEPTKQQEERERQPTQPSARASASAAKTAEQQTATRNPSRESQRIADQHRNWQGRLTAHLEQHKRYPDQARQRRAEGASVVRFVLDEDGQVVKAEIARSSGHFLLDREVRALLRRAQPLPPPPEDLRGRRLEVVVPVQFAMR